MAFKVIDNKISKFKGNIVPSRFLFTIGNINSVDSYLL